MTRRSPPRKARSKGSGNNNKRVETPDNSKGSNKKRTENPSISRDSNKQKKGSK